MKTFGASHKYMHALSAKGAEASANLTSFSKRLSDEGFISALREMYAGANGTQGGKLLAAEAGCFNWAKLGDDCTCFTTTAPSLGFLSGAFGANPPPVKARQVRKPRSKTDLSALGPQLAPTQLEDTAKHEIAQVTLQDALMDQLLTLVSSARYVDMLGNERGRRLHMLGTLVDPWSFTQTVENFFFFASIVAAMKASVSVGKDGEAYIAVGSVDKGSGGRKAHDEELKKIKDGNLVAHIGTGLKQLVPGIDRELWRDAVRAYGIREPVLAHRASTDSTAPASYRAEPYPEHAADPAPRPAKRSREGRGGGGAGADARAAPDEDEAADDDEETTPVPAAKRSKSKKSRA